jgi:steroid 5-alpha reductase family enzyme
MSFNEIYFSALVVVLVPLVLLWMLSVVLRNVSIVDIFWGLGFILLAIFYFNTTIGYEPRKIVVLVLVTVWGLRLAIYLAWRNLGKGEDYRYQQFRQRYGAHRYWWVSLFQVFLLQGVLMWVISLPLLGAQISNVNGCLTIFDWLGAAVWVVGFIFEAVGDFQLARFKANPENKGKVLATGLWKYTRHPNYFGDSAVWWGFALFSIGAQNYWMVVGSIIMTLLIIKVSGVALLEKNLAERSEEYKAYIKRTPVFIPWFPKSDNIN